MELGRKEIGLDTKRLGRWNEQTGLGKRKETG